MRVAALLAFILVACAAAPPVTRLPAAPATSTPAHALKLDPTIRKGKLDNGLTYYVMPNKHPAKRAQMWLAVNAGSVLEDDDQRGLAHFVEHMCFNGTKRFPKNTLIDFLERSGVRFGADLNAYTSFDETVYKIQVPTDRPELVDRGISVLRDFADGVTFDPAEVEKERNVVLEEWRLRRGAGTRMSEKAEAETANASRYMTRSPIGKAETIQSASPAVVARYYHDWYRPDLMAVFIVGDVSTDAVEAKLKAEFASLKGPTEERTRTVVPVAFTDQLQVSIETDPELPQVRVVISNRFPRRPLKTDQDLRRALVEQLWNRMLNGRLDELARRPDAPFLSASSGTSRPIRPVDQVRQTAIVKENGAEEGLAALLREVLRVERHGFTATELERAKIQLLRTTARRATLTERRDSVQLVTQLVRNFLTEETVTSPSADLASIEKTLPAVELAEINRFGEALAKGRQISVTGPPSMTKPTEEAVRTTLRNVLLSSIPPYEDVSSSTPLMAKAPRPGLVIDTKQIPEIGVTEWTLQNGVKVVVKPTDPTSDTIRMSAFSPGGTSLVGDGDFDSARFAADVVAQGGLGPLDEVSLRKSLSGKTVQLRAGIHELSEGITASAADDDLETMMEMVHLTFVAPRRDDRAVAAWRARQTEHYKNRQLSPEAAFAEEMTLFASQNHLRRRSPTADSLARINLDKALAIYKERFADASDFTFVFVGAIDLVRLKTLAETYLGSLPAPGKKETWHDIGVVAPPGVQTKTVVAGTEPKSRVSLTFHGEGTWSRTAAYDLQFLTDVLRTRLREVLREDMGGVYHVTITSSISRRPREEYSVNVVFGCAPENVEKLVKAIFDEAKALQDRGVADDYLARIREIKRRSRETSIVDDAYWLRQLETSYVYGDDPKLLAGADPVPRLTQDRLRAAAKKYLDAHQYLLGVLRPRPK